MAVAVLVAWLASSSCLTWQQANEAPQIVIQRERPGTVRLRLDNGDLVVLPNPTVDDGAIVSLAGGRAAALGDVRAVEVRRFHVARTLGLAALISAFALTWTAAFANQGGGDVIILPPEPK